MEYNVNDEVKFTFEDNVITGIIREINEDSIDYPGEITLDIIGEDNILYRNITLDKIIENPLEKEI